MPGGALAPQQPAKPADSCRLALVAPAAFALLAQMWMLQPEFNQTLEPVGSPNIHERLD